MTGQIPCVGVLGIDDGGPQRHAYVLLSTLAGAAGVYAQLGEGLPASRTSWHRPNNLRHRGSEPFHIVHIH
jgi:hypothetical protein